MPNWLPALSAQGPSALQRECGAGGVPAGQGRLSRALLRPPRHPSGTGLLRLCPCRARGLTSPHWGPGCVVLPGLRGAQLGAPSPHQEALGAAGGCSCERPASPGRPHTCICSVHPHWPCPCLLSLRHPFSCCEVCLLHLSRAGVRGAPGKPAKAALPPSPACRTHETGPQVPPQHPGLLSEAGQRRRGGTEPRAWRLARPGPAPAGLHADTRAWPDSARQ